MTSIVSSGKDARKTVMGVYFHGEAASFVGHDLVCLDDGKLYPDGVFDVRVYSPDGNSRMGKTYLWSDTRPNFENQLRGLIVFPDDETAVDYARELMEKKPVSF